MNRRARARTWRAVDRLAPYFPAAFAALLGAGFGVLFAWRF